MSKVTAWEYNVISPKGKVDVKYKESKFMSTCTLHDVEDLEDATIIDEFGNLYYLAAVHNGITYLAENLVEGPLEAPGRKGIEKLALSQERRHVRGVHRIVVSWRPHFSIYDMLDEMYAV